MLVKHKAEINARDDTLGETSLFQASRHGHTKVVRLFLEHGADRQATRNDRWVPSQVVWPGLGGRR